MANASPSCWGPNATYIPPARVGSNANLSVHIGGNANFSVFRYQHVGIPNAKLWRWESKPKRGHNSNGFASTYSPLQCVTPCIGASHWFRPQTRPFLVGNTKPCGPIVPNLDVPNRYHLYTIVFLDVPDICYLPDNSIYRSVC